MASIGILTFEKLEVVLMWLLKFFEFNSITFFKILIKVLEFRE